MIVTNKDGWPTSYQRIAVVLGREYSVQSLFLFPNRNQSVEDSEVGNWSIGRLRYIILLVFSVTPFKIDQNKNQNLSTDKVQNLGNERRYIYKVPRQDSGQRNISHRRYPKKCFTQTYRDLYVDAHLDELQHGGRKPTETSVTEFCYKSVNLFFEKLINIKVILFLIHELFR